MDVFVRQQTTDNRKVVVLSSLDKEVIHKFSKFLDYKNKIIKTKTNANKPNYTVSVSNQYLFSSLKKYGLMVNKTHILEKPKIPEEYIFSFLCGYFDGDGSISLNKSINSWKVSIGFASKKFYEWVCQYIESKNIIYGVENNRKTNTGKDFYIISLNGISAKHFLYLCYESLPYTLPMKRKRLKYKELSKISLATPNYQVWEIEILRNNQIDVALELINSDKRNYGWIRTKEYAEKLMRKINE